MKSLLLFALISAGQISLAGPFSECERAAEYKPRECFGKVSDAVAKSNAAANGVSPDCLKASGQFDVVKCSQENGNANLLSAGYYSSARGDCDRFKSECQKACSQVDPKDKQSQANRLNKTCKEKIEEYKKEVEKGANANKNADKGSDKTAEESKGGKDENKSSSSPAAMPPMSPQQSKDDEEKTDATQPQSTPQQAATPQAEKKEESKDGKSGFGDDTKAQSADSACSGGKFMCPGCPGFLQKCPNGNATECISKMSSSDQKIIGQNCGNTTGSSTTTQALTNPTTTPQSLMGGAGGGSSGGTSGTVSGGMNTQSMLDDGKKNDTESHEGRKEGGSLGVEGGGGGGGSSDSFGGSGGDLFGDSGNAAAGINMGKAVPRSLASAFQASQDSRVVDRFGPNLFSILGETIKGRCERNLLLHCPNRK